jgi:hypothetical protein
MAASPLAAAMLGGNETNTAALLDPALLQALPDIQMGQAMQQQSLSTAPAYWPQAVGRLAQTLAGTLLHQTGLQEAQQAYSGATQSLADVLKQTQPGNPAIAMLENKTPLVRAMGLRLAEKIIPAQATELPDEVRLMNARKVAATQGDTAAVSAIDNLLAKRQMLSNADTGVYPGPAPQQSAPAVPLSPPRIAPPSSPSLSAAVQMPTNAVSGKMQERVPGPITPGGDLTQRIAGAAATKTAAEEGAKANVKYGDLLQPVQVGSGPGQTEPLGTDHNTVLPPVKDQAQWPRNPAELDDRLKEWTKTRTEWNKSLDSGQLAEQRLMTISRALKSFQAGSWATEKADIAAKLKALGLDASGLLGDPAKAQIVLHENNIETINQLRAASPRWTQMEFKTIAKTGHAGGNVQPEANLQMLAEDIGTIRQARALPQDWTLAQQHGWRDPQSYEEAWLRHNPVSKFVDSAKTEIGPLKGMKAAPTVPEIGEVRVGHRFIGGNPADQKSWQEIK